MAKSGRVCLVENLINSPKLNGLDILQSQYAASEPVKYIIDKIEIPSLDVAQDLLIDASDLIFDLGLIDCVCGSTYPNSETLTTSTINVGNNGVSIIDSIGDAQNTTPLKVNGNGIVRKLILAGSNDTTRILEIPDEVDYWRAIRILRTAAFKNDSVFSCRCQMRKGAGGGKKLIGGSDDLIDITFELRNSILRFVAGSRSHEVTTMDLKDLKFFTVAANYPFPQSHIIDIKFKNADWNTNKINLELSLAMNPGGGDSIINYRTRLGGTVSIPVNEAKLRRSTGSIVISNGPRGSDRAIISEQLFPFEQFILTTDSSLKIDQPQPLDLLLREATGRRMAKLTVFRATNLMSPNGRTPPNPFCSICLLNTHKEKVKMPKKEYLTETKKKTSDPVWNEFFDLQGPQGIEGVAFVLIRLKDGGIGKIDPKHLGQVLIPIDTFMFGKNETEITLQLEPTEKMDKAAVRSKPLGSIVVHAELAEIPNTNNRPTTAVIQSGRAYIETCLRMASPPSTWWPLTSCTESQTTAAATSNSNIASTTPKRLTGVVAFSFECLGIKLKGMTDSFSTAIFKEGLAGSTNSSILSIPWNQVISIDALTNSVILATFTLNRIKPSNTSHVQYQAMEWDAVIGSCPAAALVALSAERKHLSEVRIQLKQFMKGSLGGVAQGATQVLPTARAIMEKLEELLPPQHDTHASTTTPAPAAAAASNNADVRPASTTSSNLPANGAAKSTPANTNTSILTAASAATTTTAAAAATTTTTTTIPPAASVRNRILIYLAQLLQGCRFVQGGPVYDRSSVRRLIRTDVDSEKINPSSGTPGGNLSASKIISKVDFLLDLAVFRIRDYVLCSWDEIHHSAQSALPLLEELLNGYHSEIRSMLTNLVGSKKALLSLRGQENKSQMITFLIREDRKIDTLFNRLMLPLGVVCKPPATLFEVENIDAIVTWYTSGLLEETKLWLMRTMDQAKTTKLTTNPNSWDVELVDGKYISTLPESLRLQFNVYLELKIPTPPASAWEEEKERAKKINDRALRSVGQCMLLLAQEYKNVLNSKQWAEGPGPVPAPLSPAILIANTRFIVSIMNDCYRLSTNHMEPFTNSDSASHISDNVAFTLVGEFNNVADLAMQNLMKIVFVDLKVKLNDFDTLWIAGNEPLVAVFAATLKDYFRDLKPVVEPFFYSKIVAGAADICVMRYLKFIKTKGSGTGSSSKFTKKQLKTLADDVGVWSNFFSDAVVGLSGDAVASKMKYMEDLRNLLTLDYTTPAYNDLVHQIARRYCIEGRQAMIRFLTTTVTLRQDGGFRLQQTVDKIIDKFKSSVPDYPVDAAEDIYIRVFREDADTGKKSGKSSGGGWFGGGKKAGDEATSKKGEAGKSANGMDLSTSSATSLSLIDDDEEEDGPDILDHLSDTASVTASTTYGDASSEQGDVFYIEVSDLKVRSLHSDSLFGSANPYVKIVLNPQRFKTTVKWNSKDASWDDFKMNFNVTTSNLGGKFLSVLVYDKERVRRKKLIGSARIPLLGLMNGGVISDWFPLESNVKGKIHGEVFVTARTQEGKASK